MRMLTHRDWLKLTGDWSKCPDQLETSTSPPIILSLSYGSRFDVLLFGLEMFMLPQLLLSLQSGKLKNLFFQTVFPFRG